MKNSKDLGVTSTLDTSLIGHKIDIDSILNQEITVVAARIKPSKYLDKGSGKCLYLQIEYKGEMRVCFNGSIVLMNIIEQLQETDYPFKATIIKSNKRYEFT